MPPKTMKARNDLTARKVHDRAAADPKYKLPLDFLLAIMADETLPISMRLDSAKSACPFVHSKLQSIDVKSEEDKTLRIEFIDFRQTDITPAIAPALALVEHEVREAVAEAVDDNTTITAITSTVV